MQPTVTDLIADIRNLSFFFVGFAVIWVFVMGCAFLVSRRARELADDVAELKRRTGA